MEDRNTHVSQIKIGIHNIDIINKLSLVTLNIVMRKHIWSVNKSDRLVPSVFNLVKSRIDWLEYSDELNYKNHCCAPTHYGKYR